MIFLCSHLIIAHPFIFRWQFDFQSHNWLSGLFPTRRVRFRQPFKAMSKKLIAFDYEVFGIVQGVFFRKFTQKEATKLQLVGWVKNTRNDTVVGQCQGEQSQIELMKRWLSKVGSPSSRIDKCEISNEKDINQLEFAKFEIRHWACEVDAPHLDLMRLYPTFLPRRHTAKEKIRQTPIADCLLSFSHSFSPRQWDNRCFA